MAKWAAEIMGYHITYVLRTAIKSQVLADFIVEWTKVQMPPPSIYQEYWTLYFNRSLMVAGARTRIIMISPTGECIEYAI